jgi:thymidylate synthase (FAD)
MSPSKPLRTPAEVTKGRQQRRKGITVRPTVPRLERLLNTAIPVLDKGFIRVIDYMGDEAAIVQAARISYGRGTKKKSKDIALIRYLMRNGHTTPFEMCEIKLHVKLPIFVARQWVRHRTANINEYSARYSILKDEFYIPDNNVLAEQSKLNRQGRDLRPLDRSQAEKILQRFTDDADRAFRSYHWLLNTDNDGNPQDETRPRLSRELARIGLPLSTYTEWYWKIDLHNLLKFIRLRSSLHAQYEIRTYASEIAKIVRAWTPNVFSSFEDYELNSISLSPAALRVVKKWVLGVRVEQAKSGLSNTEWAQLLRLFPTKEL